VGSLDHVNNNSTNESLCQVHNTEFTRADKCFIFLTRRLSAGFTIV
jgi:hypothetical protein